MANKTLLFTQKGCAPCMALKNKIQEESIQVEVINLETDRDTFIEHAVMSTPTLVKVNEIGEKIGEIMGKTALEDEHFNAFFGR